MKTVLKCDFCSKTHPLENTVDMRLHEILCESKSRKFSVSELYSIRPLEWQTFCPTREMHYADTLIGRYTVNPTAYMTPKLRDQYSHHVNVESLEHAKEACQSHYESKMREGLNPYCNACNRVVLLLCSDPAGNLDVGFCERAEKS